jgi:branched-chain amino acid transport system substrate-binding protein
MTMAAVAVIVLAGCSSSSHTSKISKTGIPSVIHLLGVRDQTGPVSYTGVSAAKGTEIAIEQIENQHVLGTDVKITDDELDTAFSPQTAAAVLTKGLTAGNITAILGPQVSSEALAVAPIAQKAGVPIVFTQSGVDGLLTSSMEFRASAAQKTIWPLATQHIIDSGAKKVAIFNSASIPTYKELGETILPPLLTKGDVKITRTLELGQTVSDFQAPVSQVLGDKPDAVIITLSGPQTPTLVTQLRQGGFKGTIYTANTMTDTQMASMRENGVGVLFPATFSHAETTGVAAQFTAAYQAKYKSLPDAFAAECYDQTWWVARAIKLANSANPAAVAKALLEIGRQGFTGAQGPLTFNNGNDAQAKGILVRWDGTKQTPAS